MSQAYLAGIDLGSTTAKLVISKQKADNDLDIVFSRYKRHHANVKGTVIDLLKEAFSVLGDIDLHFAITGSAGMGVAEQLKITFVQEVVAAADYIKIKYPDIRTFIEIGGEDSKIIFFDEKFRADMRMNGSCAGGTGAFIDQISVLLDVPVEEFNDLAKKSTRIYPIASRCGVFAKTDVQSLLSNNVPKEDIAQSAFHAVALQVLSTLTRGRDIHPKILLAGGPLTFNSELRKAFIEVIGEGHAHDFVIPENPELVPASGTALASLASEVYKLSGIISSLESVSHEGLKRTLSSIPAVFNDDEEYKNWRKKYEKFNVKRHDIKSGTKIDAILGIDSGSTTTKIVLIDLDGNVIFTHYENNKGNTLGSIQRGLTLFRDKARELNIELNIIQAAATGYGEGLIKAAFGLDAGIVETMAHFRAARHFEPEVSFILDIGGQDMKAMFIRDNMIADIQINEACSSGCGSFIETFANNMNYKVADFAELACTSRSPYDLGTRCTVFMNTKVKQALREGVPICDIAAGLSFSVINNSLYKVLKLKDINILGKKILVQGGTFKNNSVLRALEILSGCDIIRPDIPELMGALGSALIALDNYKERKTTATNFAGLSVVEKELHYDRRYLQCKGCENNCQIIKLTFDNGNAFYTENKCERIYSNSSREVEPGKSLIPEKLEMIFNRPMLPARKPRLRMGVPRVLNMFSNFVFWNTLLVESGFEVVLSDKSNIEIFELGVKTVMSENICFPAKVANGHIMNLISKKVDRIFFPHVIYERAEFDDINNTYNCPVVTGYPDVIKSAIDPEGTYNIPVDNPPISFVNKKYLEKQIFKYLRSLGVSPKRIKKAFNKAVEEEVKYKKTLLIRGEALIKEAEEKNVPLIVVAARPYHYDALINHGVPGILTELGAYVVTEDSLPLDSIKSLSDINVLTQWAYTNRLYASAKWVAQHPTAQLVQLTSFGCGPDCVCVDEMKEILDRAGKIHTAIKLDEVFNLGAAKIRLRSMLEAIKKRSHDKLIAEVHPEYLENKPKEINYEDKVIIIPYFSEYHSPIIPAAFEGLGPKVINMPRQDNDSIFYGIKNINNEMCYPAVLIAGDVIKAFETGMYKKEDTVVMLTSTGGQCRASNYVALIKKALEKAGLADVPIEVFSTTSFKNLVGDANKQKTIIKRMGMGMLLADPLSQMYLSTRAREKVPGTAKQLQQKYFKLIEETVINGTYRDCMKLLKQMVDEFNAVDMRDEKVPRIGMVGEIFVKYNGFAHMDITEWLCDQGIEVVLPPLQGFFLQEIVNTKYKYHNYFHHSFSQYFKTKVLEIYIHKKLMDVDKVMKHYRFFQKHHNLNKAAKKASEVTSIANQFGEGWLLTSDILCMLEDGVDSVVSVQPFGCLANHIVAKGVERKIRQLYPNFQLLTLDFDQSTSPVNIFNRLHFLVSSAKGEQVKKDNIA